jgi:hypothetical protein
MVIMMMIIIMITATTTTVLVVFYGCEAWYLTLWEDHRSRIYENIALRRIFGSKKEEVAGC